DWVETQRRREYWSLRLGVAIAWLVVIAIAIPAVRHEIPPAPLVIGLLGSVIFICVGTLFAIPQEQVDAWAHYIEFSKLTIERNFLAEVEHLEFRNTAYEDRLRGMFHEAREKMEKLEPLSHVAPDDDLQAKERKRVIFDLFTQQLEK